MSFSCLKVFDFHVYNSFDTELKKYNFKKNINDNL